MKLLDLLSSLSKEELRGLRRAVQSPLLTGNKRILSLFEHLRKYHPRFRDTADFREKIFQSIYPEKKFEDSKFRRICTELTQIIEEFLLLQHFRKQELEKDEQLLKIFQQRELKSLTATKIKQIHKQIDQTIFPDSTMLQTKLHLKTALYRNPAMSHPDKQKHVLAAIDSLDKYFILEKNLLVGDLKMVERTIKTKKAAEIEKTIHPLAKRFIDQNNINIQISSRLVSIVDSDDTALFFEVKQQFIENEQLFSTANQRSIFFSLINFAVRHFNLGTPDFAEELLSLYVLGLEKKYLFNQDGFLTASTFRNIVIIALKAKKIDWAENFIASNKQYLQQKEILPLCYASILMEKENYHDVVSILSKTTFSVIHDNLTSRVMIAKAYFELFLQDAKFEDVLLSYLDAFQVFIKRKKLAADRFRLFNNFIKYLKKITDLSQNSIQSAEDWKKLSNEIVNEDLLTSKRWILKKIEIQSKSIPLF